MILVRNFDSGSEFWEGLDLAIEKVLNDTNGVEDFSLIIDHVWESPRYSFSNQDILPEDIEIPIKGFNEFITKLQKLRPKCKVFFVFSYWWREHDAQLRKLPVTDILYLDYWAYSVYKETKIKHTYSTTYRWPQDSRKFLFLIGKPDKPHRLRLLWKFFQQSLDQHAVYALHLPENLPILYSKCHNILADLTQLEFDNFIKTCRRDLDDIDYIVNDLSFQSIDLHHMKYNVKLYTDTAFSVISESDFFGSKVKPHITEKTFKAIVNHHPFIVAGDTGTLDILHRYGLVTYEQFLPIPNYNQLEEIEEKLDAIVTNVKHWQQHIYDYRDEIDEITSYNKWVLKKLYYSNRRAIEDFIKRNQLDITVDQLVLTDKRHPLIVTPRESLEILTKQQWQTFYSQVRDPSWPDCNNESDFNLLPEHIQKECIEKFGYVPVYKP